jgi:hypothetical protein
MVLTVRAKNAWVDFGKPKQLPGELDGLAKRARDL